LSMEYFLNMSNTIKVKQSSVAGKVPLTTDLVEGQLAINTADEKLYSKNSSGIVVELGALPRLNRALVSARQILQSNGLMAKILLRGNT
jgi:hypothetical protein